MKVSQLANLLEHLARGLEPVVAAAVTADLLALRSALNPFAERTVAEFTKFVGQCEEFQRTGQVAAAAGRKPAAAAAAKKPGKDPEALNRALAGVQAVFAEMDRGAVDPRRIDQALQPLQSLSKPELDELLASLKIAGKAKSKTDAIGKVRQVLNNQAEAASRVMTMREDR